jgi:hypothetical protein
MVLPDGELGPQAAGGPVVVRRQQPYADQSGRGAAVGAQPFGDPAQQRLVRSPGLHDAGLSNRHPGARGSMAAEVQSVFVCSGRGACGSW